MGVRNETIRDCKKRFGYFATSSIGPRTCNPLKPYTHFEASRFCFAIFIEVDVLLLTVLKNYDRHGNTQTLTNRRKARWCNLNMLIESSTPDLIESSENFVVAKCHVSTLALENRLPTVCDNFVPVLSNRFNALRKLARFGSGVITIIRGTSQMTSCSEITHAKHSNDARVSDG